MRPLVHLRLLCALLAASLLAPGTSWAQLPGRQPRLLGGGDLTAPQLPPPDLSGAPPATTSPPAEPAEPAAPAITEDGSLADGQCHRVVRVRLLGLRRLAADDLRETVRTREGECLSRALASADARRFWDTGFFRNVEVSAEPAEGGVELRYRLQERPTIHAVRFEGYDEVDEDKLRETIDLRDGAVLSASAVRRNVQKILDLYAEKGFFLAEVTWRTERVEAETEQVDVVFRIVERAQVQVRSIRFIGNSALSSEELRGVMSTGTANFFSFLTSAGNFREDAFRNDIDMLHAAYYDRGYLTVDISQPRVSLSPDRQFIDIVINVREGPRYRVGRLRVMEVDEEGTEVEPLGGRRALRDRVHITPGEFFARSEIARDILGVQTYYRDAGYANVEVTPDIQPDPTRQIVDLGVRIVRGPVVTIHRIEIRGNAKTSERVIRREMELIEGGRYSETDYQDSRRRIMALGFFERVDLSTETVEGHPDWLVVNVEVAERPTGTFQIGAGFSSVESFIATAQIQQLNLFGRGQSLTLQAQISGLRQIFSLRFVEPYLLDSDWTFAADLYNSVRAFQDFTRRSTGGTVTFGYPILGNDLRLFATYTLENVGVDLGTSTGFFGSGNTLPSSFQRLPIANIFQAGITSSLGLSVAYDNRDNRLLPTDGVFARIGVDVADPYLLSQNTYARVTGWFRFYRPLFSSVIFKMNVQGGYVVSRLDRGVPLFERFFLGGIFDVRGYRLRTIGPRLQLPGSQDPNASLVPNGAVVGGNLQFYYNMELEFPIINAVGIRGVLFHDAGNVFNTEQLYCRASGGSPAAEIDPCTSFWSNPTALRYSVGFGIRWQSPLGLLRFEWGFPLTRVLPIEESSVFEFTIGNFF